MEIITKDNTLYGSIPRYAAIELYNNFNISSKKDSDLVSFSEIWKKRKLNEELYVELKYAIIYHYIDSVIGTIKPKIRNKIKEVSFKRLFDNNKEFEETLVSLYTLSGITSVTQYLHEQFKNEINTRTK